MVFRYFFGSGRFGTPYSSPFLQDWVPWTLVKRLSWNRDAPMEGGIDRDSKEEREKRKLRAERYENGFIMERLLSLVVVPALVVAVVVMMVVPLLLVVVWWWWRCVLWWCC